MSWSVKGGRSRGAEEGLGHVQPELQDERHGAVLHQRTEGEEKLGWLQNLATVQEFPGDMPLRFLRYAVEILK